VNATATRETCLRCGAVLSRYRSHDEQICAPCQRAELEAEPGPRILEPEQLVVAVAALLLQAHAHEPDRRVHLRAELAEQGIETDHVEIRQAVQKLRRRYGMEIDADERKPGHRLVDWPYRFKRLRGPTARACFWRRQQKTLFRV
jgi:hypothetical protein